MRAILGIGIPGLALIAAACSRSTSVANSCGSSKAAANVNATSPHAGMTGSVKVS